MQSIMLVAGARPNFMKIAPIIRAMDAHPEVFSYTLVHTGQHFDHEMSEVFFDELGIPTPQFHLNCGGGSHAQQTAKIMVSFEEICIKEKPDCVLVVGDVNSTLACSIVAKKLMIPVAHVEAGLRSGDMSMPEEINRLVTDAISDWFFVTEPAGEVHLLQEGKRKDAIFHVGHVMIDNLVYQCKQLDLIDSSSLSSTKIKNALPRYGVVTLHRPSNVDEPEVLRDIVSALRNISSTLPLVFPVHPRTAKNIESFGIDLGENITVTKPLSYMDFLNLWRDAVVVLTDSGGLQEETTALGVPCLTLRENTERPITVEEGTNRLVGTSAINIEAAFYDVLKQQHSKKRCPELWDGRSAERIIALLESQLAKN